MPMLGFQDEEVEMDHAARAAERGHLSEYRRYAEQDLGLAKRNIRSVVLRAGSMAVAATAVNYVNSEPFDLCVVGSHGRQPSSPPLRCASATSPRSRRRPLLSAVGLGAFSDYAVHNASAPVLVTKPKGSTKRAAASADPWLTYKAIMP